MTVRYLFHNFGNVKSNDALAALSALGQESRLSVFRALVKRGPEGYTPGDLASQLEIPAPTLSFHLKELQRAGLVTTRRDGRFLHYSAHFDTMRELIDFLTEQCCSLSDVQRDRACAPITSKRRRRA